jgi:diguanylate cyclase (GGDEF)-like protein/PAS domain S-box-containing protein
MGVNFTPKDTSVLYSLLAEDTAHIILKTDCQGFIVHASAGISRLGLRLDEQLIGHHLVDLVHPSSAAAVKAEHDAAIAGRQGGRWTEFLALTSTGEERWFEIQIRALMDDQDRTSGAISVMRSIEERRALEEQLFAAALTDPLTGLTNRTAFIAMLQHLVDRRIGGCLALFDIDHFKSINMQFGQSVGDEVLVVFADMMRAMMRSDDIISRIGGESLGVLLPRATPDQAEALCARVIATLSEIRQTAGSDSLSITASAGVARIEGSLDDTLKRGELALFFAKAKGRNRLEMDEGLRFPWDRLPSAKG